MPDSHDTHTGAYHSIEGTRIETTTTEDLRQAIELAFDYRGDVTVHLRDGSAVEGFVFNRDNKKGLVSLFLKGQTAPVHQSYDQIQSINFSGADTAFGKSWDAWKTKSEAQRVAEVARAAETSAKLGHL